MRESNIIKQEEDPLPPRVVNSHAQKKSPEICLKVNGKVTKTGLSINVVDHELSKKVQFRYPNHVWKQYGMANRKKLVDNLTYIFTAHMPFIVGKSARLTYNTAYPQVYSWVNQTFMRFLPAYQYLHKGKPNMETGTILRTLLNSTSAFLGDRDDQPPEFPETFNKNVVIPFTFGKDSFITYHIAKELGLNPTLVYFNEPTEKYSDKHKQKLVKQFYKDTGEKVFYINNTLGALRSEGEDWFGWELALTSWALLALPFAHMNKAAYVIYSNPKSNNNFMFDSEGYKVMPTYEESDQAVEEISLVTQSLSEGEVSVISFLMGISNLGIMAVLKDRYYEGTFKYLMSCWAENKYAKDNRWCCHCTKCARTYMYLLSQGIDPKVAGFRENMLKAEKMDLYNVFGKRASGTGWDAFGLNTEEQALAFYIAILRGFKAPLLSEFKRTPLFEEVKKDFKHLIEDYYSLHPERIIVGRWKPAINKILKESLEKSKEEILALNTKSIHSIRHC
jgi:hypothetical protein